MDRPGPDGGMSEPVSHAFGAPGIAPTWSSSDKDFVTAALDGSRLWATIGHGIINEVYWPSTGQPQVRDLGFYLVGNGRWIDLKRERRYRLITPGPALPALNIVHHGEDYQLTLEIIRIRCATCCSCDSRWSATTVSSSSSHRTSAATAATIAHGSMTGQRMRKEAVSHSAWRQARPSSI